MPCGEPCGGGVKTKAGGKITYATNGIGPGSQLLAAMPKYAKVYASLWLENCRCEDDAAQMDYWGVIGCRRRKKEIVNRLLSKAPVFLQRLKMTQTGLATLVDNAIDEAAKATAVTETRVEPHSCVSCGRVIRYDLETCRPCVNKQRLGNYKLPSSSTPHRYRGKYQSAIALGTRREATWFVAVTTAPRQVPTLDKCIASIESCGWKPTLFAEPGTAPNAANTIWNHSKKGVWGNWLSSARWAVDNTDAEFVLTVQDDSLLHPDCQLLLESIEWPERCGFVSLYTPKHYSEMLPKGINRIMTHVMWGACALAFRRETLKQIVNHPLADKWMGLGPKSRDPEVMKRRKADPSLVNNSDVAIGRICNALKLPMYFADPSPVQHVATTSTIAHGANKGNRNCGRCADHSKPLIPQLFESTIGQDNADRT